MPRYQRAVLLYLCWYLTGAPLLAQSPQVVPPSLRPGGVAGTPPQRPLPARAVADAAPEEEEGRIRLTYKDTPLEIVLQEYSERIQRTLLAAPNIPGNVKITLRSQRELSHEEYVRAIETVLAMNNVAVLEVDDTFVRVVPIAEARKEAMSIRGLRGEEDALPEDATLVSQMITLFHIELNEAKAAIDPLKHAYAQIHNFERTNSMLVTDTAENVNRMMEVLRYIDQPSEAREEPHIIRIRHTRAADIKQKLEEILRESKKETPTVSTVARPRDSGAPGVEAQPSRSQVPGVIRPGRQPAATETAETPEAIQDILEQVERGIIQGEVKMVADDRTNILIIITRPENMKFFDKIIDVLDVETDPDVLVEVFRLNFATAKDVAAMLNDLIGAASRDEPKAATDVVGGDADGDGGRSASLRELDRQVVSVEGELRKSKVGELSKDNIKILSDERTNSLIIMASKGDLATLQDIIRDMDRMLAQVLIEVVIIDISLGDNFRTGVDWVQRAMVAYDQKPDGRRSAMFSFAGGGGGGERRPADPTSLSTADLATSGIRYYFTMFDLNMDLVLAAVSDDSQSRVISTPVLLTTDNTEAKLSSTDRIYVFKGTDYIRDSNNLSANYDQRDVGLELTIKPHINDDHVVMLDIAQTISEPGSQSGSTDQLAGQVISSDRRLEANVAVRSGETIVLGGQVRQVRDTQRTKIPLLGDIPLLGRLFRFDSRSSSRTETIVFLTPYVLDTPEAVEEETRHRRDALNVENMWKRGWSRSDLATPPRQSWSERRRLEEQARREEQAEPEDRARAQDLLERLRERSRNGASPQPDVPSTTLDDTDDVSSFLHRTESGYDKKIVEQ